MALYVKDNKKNSDEMEKHFDVASNEGKPKKTIKAQKNKATGKLSIKVKKPRVSTVNGFTSAHKFEKDDNDVTVSKDTIIKGMAKEDKKNMDTSR